MISIHLQDISKTYGDKVLYKNLSIGFLPGRCSFLLGSNGSGKSTLLKISSKLLLPDMGKVQVDDETGPLKDENYRTLTGMISPDLQLYPYLTAKENIRFLAGMRVQLSEEMVTSALQKVGLEKASNQLVTSFSTGMKQRLKFAVLLASGAEVWFLDEPTSNLDMVGKKIVNTIIQEALIRKCTIVWATNEMEEVLPDAEVFHLD